ncbi:PAS domain S-box protein [Xanthobacter sediminis]|uniref:PAS domain S-box protein n=1 Tax=Xanthobacter sediminis TaxID=3119926 RepID=UPI00372AD7A2
MEDEVAQDLNQLALSRCLDAVVFIDDKNEVIFFNDAAERLWKMPRAEALGKNVSSLVPMQWRGQHDSFIETQRKTGVERIVGTTREVPVERADGTHAWGQLALSRADMDGKVFYTAFVREITDDVRRREQMRILSLVAETTGRAVMVMSGHCEAVYINQAFSEMFGYTPAELLGNRLFPCFRTMIPQMG